MNRQTMNRRNRRHQRSREQNVESGQEQVILLLGTGVVTGNGVGVCKGVGCCVLVEKRLEI